MSQSPSFLAYAPQDMQAARFPRAFAVWCFITGGLAVLTLSVDMLLGFRSSLLANLPRLFQSTSGASVWMNIMMRTWPFRFLLMCIAGSLVVGAAVVIARRGRTITAGARWLLGLSAGLLVLCGLVDVLFAIAAYETQTTQQMSLLQAVLNMLISVLTSVLPAILLFAALTTRFFDRPAFMQRLISGLLVCWGMPLLAVLIDQMLHWAMGTPPYWLRTPNYGRGMSDIELHMMNAQRLVGPFVQFSLAFLTIAAGCVGLVGGRGKRVWFQIFAIAWLVPMVLPLVSSCIHAVHGHSSWSTICATLLRYSFAGLLSLLAWLSVRFDAAGLPTP